MQAVLCLECGGTGTVTFTKERGGPVCQNCGGKGYMSKDILQQRIAAILDHPSVYMGGPSKQNMRKAQTILDMMIKAGFDIPN